jgi:hypothetical protein
MKVPTIIASGERGKQKGPGKQEGIHMITRVRRGVVHGNTIELIDEAGLFDGAEVEVVVRQREANPPATGRGLQSTEGALADDAEWDAIMDEVQEARRLV